MVGSANTSELGQPNRPCIVVGPNWIWEMEEKMVKIKKNLKVAQYRKKS
jgi:hypothetical protein